MTDKLRRPLPSAALPLDLAGLREETRLNFAHGAGMVEWATGTRPTEDVGLYPYSPMVIMALLDRIEEYEGLFALQQRRMQEATTAWRRAHPGNDLVQPDLGSLLTWLLGRIEELKTRLKPLAGDCAMTDCGKCWACRGARMYGLAEALRALQRGVASPDDPNMAGDQPCWCDARGPFARGGHDDACLAALEALQRAGV